MDQSLDQLLEELKNNTGITFSVEDSILSEEDTVARLREIVNRTHSGNSRTFYIRQFLLGDLLPEEIDHIITRYHIKIQIPRVIFLLEFPQPVTDTVRIVLDSMIQPQTMQLIQMDDTHIALLRTTERAPSEHDILSIAHTLVDELNTEAMTPVYISIGNIVESFRDLPEEYAELAATMKIGRTFYSSQNIYNSHEVGLGRLIYTLPESECRRYLEDHFHGFEFSSLDPDTLSAVHTFFDNNLNIAETARKLYVHRNTLVYRLDKFQKISGLDIRTFDDAITCKLGMMMLERLE